MTTLVEQIAKALRQPLDRQTRLDAALKLILEGFRSETGTIHVLEPGLSTLRLSAQVGLPPALLDTVRLIPVGKGIAGQTVAQGKPVTICNLQTDTTGVAKPGARQTGVGGALCVPIRHGDRIVGTLGVGTVRAYEYTQTETAELEHIGAVLGDFLAGANS